MLGPVDLEINVPVQGYYATWDTAFDPTTSNIWTAATSRLVGAEDAAGNTMRYVIHRMCRDTGAVATTGPCVTISSGGTGSTKGGGSYGSKPLTGSSQVYYRITVRTTGPKNTVSYVQAMIY